VENNIFQHITSPVIINGATTGSVFSYNYMIDMPYAPAPQYMFPSNLAHGAGVDMILQEGNEGSGFWGDNIHGSHHFMTALRNRFTGFEPGKTLATNPVNIKAFGRFTNLLGNVLGTIGYHETYEWNISGANENTSIYALGAGNGAPNDTLVKSTLLRWGNYDTVSGTVRWNVNEIPTSLSQFANAVPLSQNVPVSLYLAVRPSWWINAIPWPPIGPDVTGGSGPGGRAHKIPARVCYENTGKTNGILNFNGRNCYVGTGTIPPAPTNLRIVP
jgi:hypothetical protein